MEHRSWLLGVCVGLIAFAALPHTALAALPTVDVHTYGAVGDGATSDTQAVQKAIDHCTANKGGIIVFPAGNYVIGTVILKDNVHLRLNAGATLLGSADAGEYHALAAFTDGTGQTLGDCLIGASGATNVGIEGGGMIDGRGAMIVHGQAAGTPRKRPFLMRLVGCDGVTISGVRLQNPAAWTMNLFQCRHGIIKDVTIRSHGQGNNDGIDLDSCQDIEVKGCDIDSGDDALCLKATSPEPCRDITASHCILKSDCGAIKFGTESLGGFQTIRINDCKITGAGLGGIKLFSVDGAHIQDVVISDIEMTNVSVPIFVRLGARLKTFRPGETAKPVGTLANVVLRNIRAQATGAIGVLVCGIPGHPVENLLLDNVALRIPGGKTISDSHVDVPENEAGYPEIYLFGGHLPASGIYARHVAGLTLRHVTITLNAPDARPLMVSDDVTEFKEAP